MRDLLLSSELFTAGWHVCVSLGVSRCVSVCLGVSRCVCQRAASRGTRRRGTRRRGIICGIIAWGLGGQWRHPAAGRFTMNYNSVAAPHGFLSLVLFRIILEYFPVEMGISNL